LGRPFSALAPWLVGEQADRVVTAITGTNAGINTASNARIGASQPNAPDNKVLFPSLCQGPRGELDALLSLGTQNWLLEVQPALPAEQRHDAYKPVPHALYHSPRHAGEWQDLCDCLAIEIRRATGFDRVMVYQFRADGSGEVIAESLADGLPPYQGLRYPASDIPRIARTLYLANRHRQIPDAEAQPVAIVSADKTPPDLTLSDLRAISPIHVEYLRNMGVTASLSFPIALKNDLWGLVACHHRQPRALPLPVRERCAEMAKVFALGIAAYRSQQRVAALNGSDRDIARLIKGINGLQSGALPDFELRARLLSLVGASGAALTENNADGNGRDEILTFGKTPGPAQIREQLDWLRSATMERVFATDALPSMFPSAGAYAALASGLLAVQVRLFSNGQHRERTFLWWRPEQPQTEQWAGDPRKSVLFADQSNQLSPRSSFEAWVEISHGRSEPWSELNLLNAKKFRGLVLRDINATLFRD
jgi:light-regulated signal transduction histidine kinase (bacteriophytochrome)